VWADHFRRSRIHSTDTGREPAGDVSQKEISKPPRRPPSGFDSTATSCLLIQTISQLVQLPTARKGRCRPPCRLLIVERRQRRFRIHRRDQPIKAEHLSLSLKEAYLKGPIKRGAPPQQLRSAFWPGPGRARQLSDVEGRQRHEADGDQPIGRKHEPYWRGRLGALGTPGGGRRAHVENTTSLRNRLDDSISSFAADRFSTLVTSALVGLRRSSQRASVVTKPGSAILWSPRVGRICSMVGSSVLLLWVG
jgi:hypothetical protein